MLNKNIAFKIQQRYVLTVTAFIGIAIAYAQRAILPMAITRMVAIPYQNLTSSNTEPICEAPEWAVNKTSGTIDIDKAVIIFH